MSMLRHFSRKNCGIYHRDIAHKCNLFTNAFSWYFVRITVQCAMDFLFFGLRHVLQCAFIPDTQL